LALNFDQNAALRQMTRRATSGHLRSAAEVHLGDFFQTAAATGASLLQVWVPGCKLSGEGEKFTIDKIEFLAAWRVKRRN
jgi:hypothetical protein